MSEPNTEYDTNGKADDSDDDKTFAQSVAATVCELIDKGHTDPHADEIADAYFAQPISETIKAEIQTRLAHICKIVRDTYSNAHLVEATYYESYQDGLPGSIDEAKTCVPVGAGQRGVGIRVPQVEHDPILLAWAQQNLRGAGGKNKHNLDRLHSAYKAKRISAEDVYEAVKPYLKALREARKIEDTLEAHGVLDGPLFAQLPDASNQ